MKRLDFYNAVRYGIKSYLPMGYKDYEIHIQEKRIAGEKIATFTLQRADAGKMPVVELDEYFERIQAGADPQQTIIDLAVDYTRQGVRYRQSVSSNKRHQEVAVR